MPLIYTSDLITVGKLGVWKVEEDDAFFNNQLYVTDIEQNELDHLGVRKRKEWFSSRYLLHLLSGRDVRGACLKDAFGKPYIENSDHHISISHSADYTAVIASTSMVGIDIQFIVPKIERIAPRFISDEEANNITAPYQVEIMHTIWGAKESMYKAYGKKELDFKKHIFVLPFEYHANGFVFEGIVEKDDFLEKYTLFCHTINDLILVYAIQQ
jgi:phosphopantetheinyl transferase (holo-ACP synthase)